MLQTPVHIQTITFKKISEVASLANFSVSTSSFKWQGLRLCSLSNNFLPEVLSETAACEGWEQEGDIPPCANHWVCPQVYDICSLKQELQSFPGDGTCCLREQEIFPDPTAEREKQGYGLMDHSPLPHTPMASPCFPRGLARQAFRGVSLTHKGLPRNAIQFN